MTVWRPPAWGEDRTSKGGDPQNGRRVIGGGAHHSVNPKPLQFRKWRPYGRNTLHGFVSISAPSIGLELDDIAVHARGARRWVSLPARPMINAGGQMLRDEKAESATSRPFGGCHGLAARFSERVIALLLQNHPDALDGEP